MARFQFSLSSSDTVRRAGVVQSDTFANALEALAEEIEPSQGDTLEIGVRGFPPARFECVWSPAAAAAKWRPAGLMAA